MSRHVTVGTHQWHGVIEEYRDRLPVSDATPVITLREGGNGDDVVSLFWAEAGRIPTGEMFPSDLEFAARLPKLLGL